MTTTPPPLPTSAAFHLQRQETSTVVSRVDQARLDRLLAEHDPFKIDA